MSSLHGVLNGLLFRPIIQPGSTMLSARGLARLAKVRTRIIRYGTILYTRTLLQSRFVFQSWVGSRLSTQGLLLCRCHRFVLHACTSACSSLKASGLVCACEVYLLPTLERASRHAQSRDPFLFAFLTGDAVGRCR